MSDDRCELLCLDLPKAEALREKRITVGEAERRSAPLRALGDPTRLMLAAALAETDELCVCDLSWISERSEKLVSHHLRALRAAGLASARREGKMVMYSLTAEGRTVVAFALSGGASRQRVLHE